MSEKLVGIKYIGKKETQEDSVNGTDAIWYGFGDVINFSVEFARNLLVHKDSFEAVEPNHDAPVFNGEKRTLKISTNLVIEKEVTKEEYALYKSGHLELLLVPVDINAEFKEKEDEVIETVEDIEALKAEVATLEDGLKEIVDEEAVEAPALEDAEPVAPRDPNEPPTLEELVESMVASDDIQGLRLLLKQEDVTYANRMTSEQLGKRALIEIPRKVLAK